MSVIDAYLEQFTPQEQSALQHIRSIIHELAPESEEVISYGMPGFKYNGKYLVGFNAFHDHLSLFPTGGPIAELHDQLADFKTSKGTIQFSLDHPIPDALIRKIILSRIQNIDTV